MVTDAFGILLEDLSKILNIPDLHPDRNHSCLIKFPDGLKAQLEIDRLGENLIIGIDVGEPDVGRYRENLFREALKSNGLPNHAGIFAFSQKSKHMILYDLVPLKDINAEKVAAVIQPLVDKALIWSEAISRGDVPSVQGQTSGSTSGMFGLR